MYNHQKNGDYVILASQGLLTASVPQPHFYKNYLDLVQRLEFGVDNLQKNAVYQIE